MRDVPIIGGDPSIVIGPFVLSGWGPREIQQEQERRQSIQDTAQQKFRERLAPVLVAAATVVVARISFAGSLKCVVLDENEKLPARRQCLPTITFAVHPAASRMECSKLLHDT